MSDLTRNYLTGIPVIWHINKHINREPVEGSKLNHQSKPGSHIYDEFYT